MVADRSELYRLYWDKNYSLADLAQEYDVSSSTVHRWFNRLDIPTRSRSEAANIRHLLDEVPYSTFKDGYERWMHQYRYRLRCVRVHRLLAVAEHGMESVKGKDVHHVNGIPWDNRSENLEILSSSEHAQRHAPGAE